MRPDHVSTGERVVLCNRKECAFSGDAVKPSWQEHPVPAGVSFYFCEAEIVVLDRRAAFRKTCGRFAKKTRGG